MTVKLTPRRGCYSPPLSSCSAVVIPRRLFVRQQSSRAFIPPSVYRMAHASEHGSTILEQHRGPHVVQ